MRLVISSSAIQDIRDIVAIAAGTNSTVSHSVEMGREAVSSTAPLELIECANESAKRGGVRNQAIIASPAIQIIGDISNGVLPIGGMNSLEGVVAVIAPELVDTDRRAGIGVCQVESVQYVVASAAVKLICHQIGGIGSPLSARIQYVVAVATEEYVAGCAADRMEFRLGMSCDVVIAGSAVDGVLGDAVFESVTTVCNDMNGVVAASADHIGSDGYASQDKRRHICRDVDRVVSAAAVEQHVCGQFRALRRGCTLKSDSGVEVVVACSAELNGKSVQWRIALLRDNNIGCESVVAAIADQCCPVERAAQAVIAGKAPHNVAVSLCAKDIGVSGANDPTVDGIYKGKPIERSGICKRVRSHQLLGQAFNLIGIRHSFLLGIRLTMSVKAERSDQFRDTRNK
ncbi:hypothetical protein ACVJGD_001430 [Bradyrhizobium sp. USDA 10063]